MKPIETLRKSAFISIVSLSALFSAYGHPPSSEHHSEPHDVEEVRPHHRRRECPPHSAEF